MEVIEWNPGERMKAEYALSMVESIRKFIRARYYMPEKQAFNGIEDLEAWMQELDGLKEYIKCFA